MRGSCWLLFDFINAQTLSMLLADNKKEMWSALKVLGPYRYYIGHSG